MLAVVKRKCTREGEIIKLMVSPTFKDADGYYYTEVGKPNTIWHEQDVEFCPCLPGMEEQWLVMNQSA